MPKPREVDSLENIAINFVADLLARPGLLSDEPHEEELRKIYTVIKESLFPELRLSHCDEIWKRASRIITRNQRIHDSDLTPQIVMDTKIIAIKDEFNIFGSDSHIVDNDPYLTDLRLTLKNAFRFNKHLSIFEDIHLTNITTFAMRRMCNDDVLKVIGQNCPNLKILNINYSYETTDVGLYFLSSCTKLRSVAVAHCPVTHDGIIGLFKNNNNINHLVVGIQGNSNGLTHFGCFDWPVKYTSLIERLSIEISQILDDHLKNIVNKFSNLTSLMLAGESHGDISVLKSLDKLTKLEIYYHSRCPREEMINLLQSIGSRITELTFICATRAVTIGQREVDFIFENCINLEKLKFSYCANECRVKLFVPPFKKLILFECRAINTYSDYAPLLEFREMLNLEEIILPEVYMTTEALEEIILDDTRFPNLRLMKLADCLRRCDLDYLNQLIWERNVDLEIEKIV